MFKRKEKTALYFGLFFVLILTVLLCIPFSAEAATIKTQAWALYSKKGYVDVYNDSSNYYSYIKSGADVWNDYKSGVIRKKTSTNGKIPVRDTSEVNNINATTYASHKIVFNTYNMKKLSEKRRQNVGIHELGHALGLAHNTEDDIMYKNDTTRTTLSKNDKASYTISYNYWKTMFGW